MELKEMICKRKSIRSYTGELVNDVMVHQILTYLSNLTPLYPDIKIQAKVVEKDQIKCILPWIPPQAIAIFSEKKEGAYENAGFLFQQLDLYLQSIGLGTCWLGMGKMTSQDLTAVQISDHMKFVMLLSFGYPKEHVLRTSPDEFKRKSLNEIADKEDSRLEPARLAPSSVNSQPWFFTHEDDCIHAYCTSPKLLKIPSMTKMNRIDMGIALAHMYVANPDTFRFFRAESPKVVKGYDYIGSFSI